MKRFYITGILAIALLVVAAACGGDDDTPTAVPRATSVPVPTSTPVPEPEGVAGGTLKLGLYRSFPGLLIWENTVFDVAQLVLPATNGLVGTDPEQSEPVIVSELAETWSLENDTTAVFNLRRGVTFHDGVGFTCAHAKWSVDTIRTGDGMDKSPRKPLFANVASVECRDDYTLVLNLSQPYAPLIPVLSMGWNQILPKHVADLNGLEFFRTEGLIGTGPFKVDHVVPGEEYRASRYDNYWNDPFPYLDGHRASEVRGRGCGERRAAGRADPCSAGPDLRRQGAPGTRQPIWSSRSSPDGTGRTIRSTTPRLYSTTKGSRTPSAWPWTVRATSR